MGGKMVVPKALLLLATLFCGSLCIEQNLTALFHEALSNDGSLQSSVGMASELSDLELVYLRKKPAARLPDVVINAKKKRKVPPVALSYTFKAFGKDYNLHLVPMQNLVSAKAEVSFVGSEGERAPSRSPIPPTSCLYTHVDHFITAALNGCKAGTLTGFIVKENTTIEVRPLRGSEVKSIHRTLVKRGRPRLPRQGIPHLVRRVVKRQAPRPNPFEMELEIPPPACSEPLGNAVPDEMEFGQGEILTIPPVGVPSSPSPPPVIEVAFFPEVEPSPSSISGMEQDPEGLFLPPLPNFMKRKPSEDPANDRPPSSEREPKPMKGVDRDPKPIVFTPKEASAPGFGDNREPKPMKGVDREPKPLLPQDTQMPKRSGGGGDKTVELGVFFDQAAYDLFFPYLGSQEALTDVILGYINGIQALFHHPTLGQKIHLVINYIEVMPKQPETLHHFGGDREKLYESFRLYNERKNQEATNKVDGNPWDMGILISGLNFYSVSKPDGKTSYSTMGLAAVRGVCHSGYSAVIVELGATDTWGKPYPSAGFASVYVMAHEMGHNLGMLHDGYGNSCPKNGFVMSASRSTSGETNWSSCSREIIETLQAPCLDDVPSEPSIHDHSIYDQLPGQSWDAYDQCRVFLRDDDATLYNETIGADVCQTVMCRSPHRIGYFKAGPALDGTYCGKESWCIAGTCTPWPADRTPKVVLGGWSSYEHTECSSGCIEGGMGIQVSRRKCTNPKPQNTDQRCPGQETTLTVCDDTKVCNGKRLTITSYADEKCGEFSQVVQDLKAVGAQAPHNPDRKWQACAIFCQRASGTWYSPRTDLSHLAHFDTYFPDGTACHKDGNIGFYCQRHQCLPRGERQAKELQEPDPEWDVHVYQNAPPRPSNNTVPEQVARIFELSENMDPIQQEPLDLTHEDDEDLWEDNDYYHPH
ncbi:LOW QUALITY PROTEIN: A disintegrin and metalloproteinase with thrombospondin motifs 10-like [Palaemon carinicauda]|uniref:LOW QUALITY PROTEIN: A disintegrin and metalloproteinase with thrombospondin motifs 10-like n=1 Tax=Palaemon carinicauda TaxID=392227 RepID=UPI0035B5DFAF